MRRLIDAYLLWRMVRRDNDCGWEGDRTEAALRRAIDRRKSK